MNIETGKLYESLAEALKHEELSDNLKEVPKKLDSLAKKELNGKKITTVDMNKNTPLTKWAQQERHRAKKIVKRKAHRKIAKASRKRNRK